MLTDSEIFGRLLSAAAALEAVESWPPEVGLVRVFEDALDGVTRRFLNDPRASSDGYIARDLARDGDGIFTAGDLHVLSDNADKAPPTRRTEARLSSADGGWIHVCSEEEQQQFEALTRRRRATATGIDKWFYTVDVPAASSQGSTDLLNR